MLVELRVRDLGVIEDVDIELGEGMTALTGETGAGKTLVVEALGLLLGARGGAELVRQGCDEAVVEGRFISNGEEVLLARSLPAKGRSKAWIDGRMAPLSALEELGTVLVDMYGQHSQQSLLHSGAQRRALDAFGGVDLQPMLAATSRLDRINRAILASGGDEDARRTRVELLSYQIAEIEEAAIASPAEDEDLESEEERLANAAAHRFAAATALSALAGEIRESGAGVDDLLREVCTSLGSRAPLSKLASRAVSLQAEAADLASELRHFLDSFEEDPGRLAEVRRRRQLLHDLSRKYGGTLGQVIRYADSARSSLTEMVAESERVSALILERDELLELLSGERSKVARARREAAPELAAQVTDHLRRLAMASARVDVAVDGPDPADAVTFLLQANPGEPLLPLAKVASGGELARVMLALRLVLTEAPPTMVFDEVDAGVGGEAALSVGRALADVASRHQVLVVTHLAQVAAFADRQMVVRKQPAGGRTTSRVESVKGEDRIVELARMLSGHPDSPVARGHATELLGTARGPGDPTAP